VPRVALLCRRVSPYCLVSEPHQHATSAKKKKKKKKKKEEKFGETERGFLQSKFILKAFMASP
jgi:hypothetical protein